MMDQLYLPVEETQKHRRVLGEKCLIALFKLTTAVKMYQSNNQVLRDCAQDFMGILGQLIAEEGFLTITVSRGQFFLQDEKPLYQRENINIIKEMLDYFEKRKIPGFRFNPSADITPIDQILTFTRLLNNAAKKEDPLSWFSQKLSRESFSWVDIISPPPTEQQETDEKLKEVARETYTYALSSVKEVSEKISSQGRASVRKLKRIVQNMVDFLSEDDSILFSMSTVRDYDDYTYTHSVNVAILSLCLGKRIGLSRVSLSWLGICGLVHDLGKLDIPKDILKKPGKLSPGELKEMERHPLKSVSQILKLQASRDLKTRILLPPLEHHMKYDFTGYPKAHRKQPISLIGRIISIADVFDALSSPRVYRAVSYSPDQVLGIMIEGSGKDFDPILLKVFINMLGVYPVGTLLKLDTGEIGLVVPIANDCNKARPQIILLKPNNEGGYIKGNRVSLTEKNSETGAFVRNIVSSHHPLSYNIQPVEFIL